MTTIERLEKKYGVRIREDYYDTRFHRQLYRMCSADGCPWEKGLTLKGLREECKTWEAALLDIKQKVEASRERARAARA